MNLTKFFQMQRLLDLRIEIEHPLAEGEDRLAKKILALQVELGELANELPEVFKFWSNRKSDYEKALKEYVDGLHFIISLGLEIGTDITILELQTTDVSKWETVDKQFNYIFYLAGSLPYVVQMREKYYINLFVDFIGLGEMLGFTWEQIESAYISKNEINHTRQSEGY